MSRSWTQNVAAPGRTIRWAEAAGLRQIKRLQIHRLCSRQSVAIHWRRRPWRAASPMTSSAWVRAAPRAALPTRPPAHAGTTQPSTPSSTFSGRPPTSLTTTTSPWPSFRGKRRKWSPGGTTTRNPGPAPPERAHIPSRPTKITRSCMPSDSTQRNWSSSGGSPAISTTIRLRSARQHGHGFQHVRPVLVASGAGIAADYQAACLRWRQPAFAGERLLRRRGRREIVHVDPIFTRKPQPAGEAHQAALGVLADADHAIRGQVGSQRRAQAAGGARIVLRVNDRRTPAAQSHGSQHKAGDRPRRSRAPGRSARSSATRACAGSGARQRAIRP